MLVVSIVGCDFGFFMLIVGWFGVLVFVNGIIEIMVVVFVILMLLFKFMLLLFRIDKWKKDIYFFINILDDVFLLIKLG